MANSTLLIILHCQGIQLDLPYNYLQRHWLKLEHACALPQIKIQDEYQSTSKPMIEKKFSMDVKRAQIERNSL